MAKNKNKNTKRNEFRKFDAKKAKRYGYKNENKDSFHLNYVYERVGDYLSFLSMTHNPPKWNENNYIKLERSVDINDKKPAYINTQPDTGDYRAFGKKQKGCSFSDNDKKTVAKIIKKIKKKKGK